jgi:hypothetical protein
MAIDEAAVLKRAKELCEQDGYAWDLDYAPPTAVPVIPRVTLSEEARQQYLQRARAELGAGNA